MGDDFLNNWPGRLQHAGELELNPTLGEAAHFPSFAATTSCEDCPLWGELFLSSRTRGHPGDGLKFLRDRALELNLL